MKVSLVYLHILSSSDPISRPVEFYKPFTERFAKTFQQFRPSIPHELYLHVVFCGRGPTAADYNPLRATNPNAYHTYRGTGWDIGAYQHVAKEIDSDFIVFLATPLYFWKHGWLERLVAAREHFGDGLYGPMASFENNPHIRSTCFGCSPALMATWPVLVDSRDKCAEFESWGRNFSLHVIEAGKPCKMVTWDNCYDKEDWRKPANIFRRGDQSNCPVWDRHTDIYRDASEEDKRKLEAMADGKQ